MNGVIPARQFLTYTEEQIWALDDQYQPTDIIQVQFDDESIFPATNSGIIVSWYLWKMHRLYPETPLLPPHYIGYEFFKCKMMSNVLTKIIDVLVPTYWDRLDFDKIAKEMYEVMNDIYNMVNTHLEGYVDTLDARDIIEILYHPEVQRIRQTCIQDGSPKAIRTLYEEMPKVVSNPSYFPTNGLAAAMNTKATPVGQILQSIGVRGYVTDINSAMFPNPILDCFGGGIHNIADYIIESRSASKALYFQKDPIRDTEYFNRRLQLLNQSVRWIIPGDCGTTDVLEWHVQPGDVQALDGKYYYDENNELKHINARDRKTYSHLTGKTIRMRSPTMCNHAHKGGVCQRCLGRLAYTIPVGTNIGHVAAYKMGEKITQSVLSVKHLDNSTEIKEISLDKNDLKYVRLSTKRNELIKFNENLANYKNVKILLNVEDVGNLTQAMATDKLTELSVFKISNLNKIGVKYEVDDMEIIDWVTVSGPSRPSSLTIKFLEHIREVGYVQEDAKYIEVKLDGWNFERAAFVLPQKQVNMLDFMKQVSNMLECGPKIGVKKGLNPSRPEDLVTYLRTVYEYSSQYISIPLMYLEITTLATLVTDLANNDYRIPKDKYNREFSAAAAIIHSRSVGTALAYEEQAKMLYTSHSYDKHNRVPHPIDNLFYPDPNDPLFSKWKYKGK